MPAIDSCQPEVLVALQNDGWQVTIPRRLKTEDFYAHIDLEAEKESDHILIEVKCFPGANDTQELYTALGQYLVYREILAALKPGVFLWLAVPQDVYQILVSPTIAGTARHNHVKIIVVETSTERIAQWIDW